MLDEPVVLRYIYEILKNLSKILVIKICNNKLKMKIYRSWV